MLCSVAKTTTLDREWPRGVHFNKIGRLSVSNGDVDGSKIFVKFRNSKQNVLKIVLIIVNINKDENKSLISNQFSLRNDFPPTSWRTILRR
jgi:hypothetical protein